MTRRLHYQQINQLSPCDNLSGRGFRFQLQFSSINNKSRDLWPGTPATCRAEIHQNQKQQITRRVKFRPEMDASARCRRRLCAFIQIFLLRSTHTTHTHKHTRSKWRVRHSNAATVSQSVRFRRPATGPFGGRSALRRPSAPSVDGGGNYVPRADVKELHTSIDWPNLAPGWHGRDSSHRYFGGLATFHDFACCHLSGVGETKAENCDKNSGFIDRSGNQWNSHRFPR